jgi:hypothetical protein
VELPAETADLDINLAGDQVAPLPAVLDATTLYVAAVDRLLVVATDTGQVSTLTPSQPPARTSDELGPYVGNNPALPPLLTAAAHRKLVISPFLVKNPGKGTAPARTEVEVVAVDTATEQSAWTSEIPLGDWAQQATSLVQVGALGVAGQTIVLVAGDDNDSEAFGVDLTTHRTVWTRPGLRAGAMAGALFIGVMTGEQQDRVVAVAAADGRQRWTINAGTRVRVEPGSPTVVVMTGVGAGGGPYLSLLGTDGKVKNTSTASGWLRYEVNCHYDGVSLTVCDGQLGGDWAGAFDRTGNWLWQLPDKTANRIAPRITTAWHGMAYGRTAAGPIVLNARTGTDREQHPGVAPYVVDSVVGIASARDGGLGIRAYRTTG